MIDLIYCAGGNPLLSHIEYEEGWLLGVRSDASTTNLPQTFIDIDYKKPNFERHVERVKKFKPKYATVTDLSDKHVDSEDVNRALRQVEMITPYCEIPLVVPKLSGQVAMLPSDVAIGYSIASSYGGAQFPIWELEGRRVHLLGGSPKKQMEAYRYLSTIAVIVSADGNYAQKLATRYGEYWQNGRWVKHPGVATKEKDIYFDCWRHSCRNLLAAWRRIC